MPILYDHRGNPVSSLDLQDDHETRQLSRNATAWELLTAGTQITPEWVTQQIRRTEQGDVDAFMLLAQRMEERLPSYGAALLQRKQDVGGAEFLVDPASDAEVDQQIAKEVRAILDSDAFQLWMPDLLDAIGKGYSVGSVRWEERDGRLVPVSFRRVRPQDIRFDSRDGETPYLKVAHAWALPDTIGGQTQGLLPLGMYPGRYIPHVAHTRSELPINSGLAKTVAYLYLYWTSIMGRWAQFGEVYGMPAMIGKVPEGASRTERAKMMNAMRAIAQNARVVISGDMDITEMRPPMSGSAGADDFFVNSAEYLDKMIVIACTGQSLTQDEGSSRALGEVHERRLAALIRSDAFQASATIRRHLLRAYVDVNYGANVVMPHARLDVEDAADLKALAEGLAPLVDRGLQISVAEVLDRAGLPVPQDLAPDLMLHPENGAPSQDTEIKAQKLGHALGQVVAAANDSRSARDLRRKISQIVAEVPGYSVSEAA